MKPNQRMALLATVVILLDQFTKALVLKYLGFAEQKVIIDGFFKLVHLGNTGAAWSLFYGNNELLAIVSLVALLFLFLYRHHFEVGVTGGQIALGLIFGGIVGNVIDRLFRHHVIDFLYFYVYQKSGRELSFPAFNVADSAICIGVGLLFILTWKHEQKPSVASAEAAPASPPAAPSASENRAAEAGD